MHSNNINPLDKAINLRQLQMAHDAAVQFAESADPASDAMVNEYSRVLAALYQVLEDAQQVVVPARQATSLAEEKALLADSKAADAESAAAAAAVAATQVEDAKGTYASLSDRLDTMEQQYGFTENSNPMSLVG